MNDNFNLEAVSEMIASQLGVNLANTFTTEYLLIQKHDSEDQESHDLLNDLKEDKALESFFVNYIDTYFVQPINYYNYARESFRKSLTTSTENEQIKMIFEGLDEYSELEQKIKKTESLIKVFKEMNKIE